MSTIEITHLQSAALMLAWDKLHDLGERLPKIAGWHAATYMGDHDQLDPSAEGESKHYDSGYCYESVTWSDWHDRFKVACERKWPIAQGFKLAKLSEADRMLKYTLKVGIEAVAEIDRAVWESQT